LLLKDERDGEGGTYEENEGSARVADRGRWKKRERTESEDHGGV
jgi:hypothetical protein